MIKQITYGQDTIIIGRGATEPTAWALARKLSAKRKNWHNVYHRLDRDWHRVTCCEGRDVGHTYNAGNYWWSANMTISGRAEQLRKAA